VTWTNPPIVATGDFITAGLWNTYIRGNGLHLRGFLPDAPASNHMLITSSTTAAAWSSYLPDAMLESLKLAKTGGNVTGDVTITAELAVRRAASPTQGYIFFGTGAHWVGYTGSAFQADGNTLWHSGNDGSGSGLDADTVDAIQGATITAGLVPTGMIAAFPLAVSIPAGWTRYTNLDGRIPVGDGTTFSVTFTQGNFYGSSWSHGHTGPLHGHTSAALTVTGSTGTESNSATFQSGVGASGAASAHTHPATSSGGTLDVGGSTDNGGNSATSTDQWLPLMRAIVWAYKT
jgi:hypothetical protein